MLERAYSECVSKILGFIYNNMVLKDFSLLVCFAQLATKEETDDLSSRTKVLSLDLLQVQRILLNIILI